MRIVCWFSCGAASAVATKLAIAENAGKLPLIIAYTEVAEEHPDNKRFLHECEAWFGQEIQILRNEKYQGSIFNVFEKNRYIVGIAGAPCTKFLKKEVRQKFEQLTDRQVFGYTAEEQHRLDRFIDANNDVDIWTPLIDKGLSKEDCLAMLQNANIELPEMYRLGYHNNNCIGCVKGGLAIGTRFVWIFRNTLSAWQNLSVSLAQALQSQRVSASTLMNCRQMQEITQKNKTLSVLFFAIWLNRNTDELF